MKLARSTGTACLDRLRRRASSKGNLGGALVFELSLSVASTVVLLRALESRGILDSANGRIAVARNSGENCSPLPMLTGTNR